MVPHPHFSPVITVVVTLAAGLIVAAWLILMALRRILGFSHLDVAASAVPLLSELIAELEKLLTRFDALTLRLD